MISYKPLFNTMIKRNITEYNLIYKQGLSSNTIHRIKQGKPITTQTINTLCEILECRTEDIIEYIEDIE